MIYKTFLKNNDNSFRATWCMITILRSWLAIYNSYTSILIEKSDPLTVTMIYPLILEPERLLWEIKYNNKRVFCFLLLSITSTNFLFNSQCAASAVGGAWEGSNDI